MTSTNTEIQTTDTTDFLAAMGATSERMIDNNSVNIPDNRRCAFSQEVTHFSALPNTHKRELTMPSEADADLLRLQLRQYAREFDLICSFPDKAKDGRLLNAGCTVTYRIAARKADDDQNGEVEVTSVSSADDAETVARTALASAK